MHYKGSSIPFPSLRRKKQCLSHVMGSWCTYKCRHFSWSILLKLYWTQISLLTGKAFKCHFLWRQQSLYKPILFPLWSPLTTHSESSPIHSWSTMEHWFSGTGNWQDLHTERSAVLEDILSVRLQVEWYRTCPSPQRGLGASFNARVGLSFKNSKYQVSIPGPSFTYCLFLIILYNFILCQFSSWT